MTIILFALSMFGNLSALRLISVFRDRALISADHLTKIGTGSCVIINLILFFSSREIFFAAISVMSALGVIIFTLWLLERRQIDTLKKEIPCFIDRWILNMKLGKSLSAARTAALSQMSTRTASLISPLFIGSISSRRTHLILDQKVLNEFLELSESPHSALQRLQSARESMRKSENFRRKSGQAVRQATIQSAVLLFLLIALAMFTVHRYGWRRNSDLLTASLLLSGLNLVCMRYLAGKKRWMI